VAFDYVKMAATALKLLERFGGDVVFAREIGGSINPITGAIVAGTDASVTTTGLLKKYPDKMIDGTRILTGDRELVLSNEQEPLPSDKPIIAGEEWSIVEINTAKPFDTVIVYFCQLRR
jgi:hypothetical protein